MILSLKDKARKKDTSVKENIKLKKNQARNILEIWNTMKKITL